MKIIRNTAFICLGLTILIVAAAFLISEGILPLHFSNEEDELNAVEELAYYAGAETDDYTLSIPLPNGMTLSQVAMEFDAVTRELTVTIPGIDQTYFYEHHLSGGTTYIDKVTYSGNSEAAAFHVFYNDVFAFEGEVKDGNLLVKAHDPREDYDYIVVIDAGHGGQSSPGTVWNDVKESQIDLSIATKLQKLLQDSDLNIGIYMTRTLDRDVPLASRVELANLLEADLFLSIHNNTTGLKRMDDTNGTEVMYNELDESGRSQAFAEICEECLVSTLDSKDRGVVEGSENVEILRESEVPVALAEIGFMSNAKELRNLTDGSYQQRAAQALKNAIETALTKGL